MTHTMHLNPRLRDALLVLLALWLGAYVHESIHSVQSAALGNGWSVPYLRPMPFPSDCPPEWLGCTDIGEGAHTSFWTGEGVAYLVEAIVTSLYTYIFLTMKRKPKEATDADAAE
ncbi:MAG: hypothetical protein LC623_05475 [Halobacteriales archaeon]|nr:hypothetical protein [Halobacteriales archaeon]